MTAGACRASADPKTSSYSRAVTASVLVSWLSLPESGSSADTPTAGVLGGRLTWSLRTGLSVLRGAALLP